MYCCITKYHSIKSNNSINLKISSQNSKNDDRETDEINDEDNELIVLLEAGAKNGILKNISNSSETCRIPALNFDAILRILPNRNCKIKENIGFISKDHIWHFSESAKAGYSDLNCFYRVIERIDDFKTRTNEFKPLSEGQKILDEVVEVHCNQTLPKFHFSSLYPQIISKLDKNTEKINEKLHKPDEKNNKCAPLNVMVLSYDSVSRVSWVKYLKKTHKFITETMNFDILNGYNIVGDGTPAGIA